MTQKDSESPGVATILLVEDEPLVRESTALLLEVLGYKVLVAGNGPEGVRLLDQVERIDLLLTDVVMPGGMSARELAERARMYHSDLEVLMLSAYPQDDLIESGKIGEGTPLMSKPFRTEELAQAIRDLLRSGISR